MYPRVNTELRLRILKLSNLGYWETQLKLNQWECSVEIAIRSFLIKIWIRFGGKLKTPPAQTGSSERLRKLGSWYNLIQIIAQPQVCFGSWDAHTVNFFSWQAEGLAINIRPFLTSFVKSSTESHHLCCMIRAYRIIILINMGLLTWCSEC